MYTVKQLSELAGVTIRTLHYYDEIDLLKPSQVGENGYRYYEDADLYRLQQILFYREMDIGLLQIREIIDNPAFDQMEALQTHRRVLQDKINRLLRLIRTVDSTIMHLVGEVDMSKKQLFAGFDEEKQKQYEKEAIEQYGEDSVKESNRRWKNYTKQDKERILAEGNAVYNDLAEAMPQGPESPAVQAILVRWHQHIRYFYEPTIEVLRGLGQLYSEQPEFVATFEKFHPDLPAFLPQAINHYCDTLESNG